MDLNLTGGVLFSLLIKIKRSSPTKKEIKELQEDPVSEFNMIKELCMLIQGASYSVNDGSLRTALTDYKNCKRNGNSLICLEANKNTNNECSFFVNQETTKKRILLFINNFINTDNEAAVTVFVNTISEIISSDNRIKGTCSDNELVQAIVDESVMQISFEDYLYNVISCVILSHTDNCIGIKTLTHVNNGSYKPNDSNIKVVFRELSPEQLKLYSEELKNPINVREGWEEYINNLKMDYKDVAVYYNKDQEIPFKDIYVASSISNIDPYGYNWRNEQEFSIDNPTSKLIANHSQYTIISGAGGLGKTMLMHYLLLDAIDNDLEHIPLYITVRNYKKKYKSFIDFIYEQCSKYSPRIQKEEFLRIFNSNQCLLLLDGFDEITYESQSDFINVYNDFISTDMKNIIIMSSRPVGGALPKHFSKMYILPFNIDQSCELIKKLALVQNNTAVGNNFIKELRSSLFKTHKSYAENPLLLTLMFRIFQQNARVPKDKYDFYVKAYDVLSYKHDVCKEEGGFSRSFMTGLNPTEFADCFKEFCAYSLLDGKVSFSDSEMQHYFNLIKIRKEKNWSFELKDFIYDATVSTGLMYIQRDTYYFIHRSMQEYFCAAFIMKQEDSLLFEIAKKLQSHGKGLCGETLMLLDDQMKSKMKKYVYLPYLETFFGSDIHEDKYSHFLKSQYNYITYVHFTSASSSFWFMITPKEPLYDLCMRDKRAEICDGDLDLPEDERLIDEPVYDYYDYEGDLTSGLKSDIPSNYDYDKYGEPEVVGYQYGLSMEKVLADPEEYDEVTDIIMSDDFPLKREFFLAEKYWQQLKEESAQQTDNDDLFAKLH